MNIEKNILNYWKEINLVAPVTIKVDEYFTKQEVISKKRLQIPYNKISDSLLLKNSLKNLSDNGIEISFGNIKNTILYNKAKIERDNIVDGEGGETFIFTFNINENGKYIVETFKVSVFLYVLLKNLISEPYKNIVEKINDFEKDVEIELKSVEKFDEDYLKKITDIILQKLEIFDTDLIEKNKVFYLKLISIKETEEVNEDRLMQMNFYNEDLERIIKNIDNSKSFLPKIIYSNLKNNERYKIDDDIDFLQEITLPKNIPLGKWPSKHNPSLMQAVAINIVTSKEYSPKIFSVNGPPGTGKTTLLKEIIADTIIKKAKIIADSDTIFENKSTETTKNYYRNYYKISNKIRDLGIIVASNNNSAVENISKELPKSKDTLKEETLTNLFDIKENENIYFTKLASKIFKNEGENYAWGLVSVPYGRKENIDKIKDLLPDRYTKLEEFNFSSENQSFSKEREKFTNLYKQLEDYKQELEYDVNEFLDNKKITKNLIPKINKEEEKKLIEKLKENFSKQREKEKNVAIRREERENFKNGLSLIQKTFNKIFGEKNPEIIRYNHEIQTLNLELEKLEEINKDLNQKIEETRKIKESFKRIEYFKNKYKKSDEDLWLRATEDDFYNKITDNGKSQETCPWSIESFNILREQLFAQSLKLIESFIVNSKEIKQNLKLFKLLLENEEMGYNLEEKKAVFKEGFYSLNLLVPVLSTTFASVARIFKNFDENELGIAIIDEAGQATPFSAMGLLYRSSSCIVVGDPLQVEPVITTPATIIRTIAQKYGIDKLEKKFNIANEELNYTSLALSIQTLVDSANKYYGKIGETEVGCPLVVHRRCLSPMFDISNEISYDKRMINKSFPDNKKNNYVIVTNEFIDVKGCETGNGNHSVKEQEEIVKNIIKIALESAIQEKEIEKSEKNVFGDKKLFIISPFTSVINSIKKELKNIVRNESYKLKENDKTLKELFNKFEEKKIINWIDNSFGTVHKFQGKEANSVILLLGCDKNSKEAATWAAKKANILNVAVTRAKKRFVIIGDLEVWGDLPNFKNAIKILNNFK